MKKYLFILIISGFALGLYHLSANPAEAAYSYEWGCQSGARYDIRTGAPCGAYQVNYWNNSNAYGCLAGGRYNTMTGEPCYGYNSPTMPFDQQFRIGDRGPEVASLQEVLAGAGFYTGRIDGIYGWMTHTAFLNYQNLYPYKILPVGGGYGRYISPVIDDIDPSRGRIGTEVTIYGEGFWGCSGRNCAGERSRYVTVNFGPSVIADVYAEDDTSLTFVVPSHLTPPCRYESRGCYFNRTKIEPGIYEVSVTNAYGTSNEIDFTVLRNR